MNAACKNWTAAASIGAVEAMKDQGLYRWNYFMRSLQQQSKSKTTRLYNSLARRLCAHNSAVSNKSGEEMMKKPEESLRKVMYLSSWGPY